MRTDRQLLAVPFAGSRKSLIIQNSVISKRPNGGRKDKLSPTGSVEFELKREEQIKQNVLHRPVSQRTSAFGLYAMPCHHRSVRAVSLTMNIRVQGAS